MDDCFFCNEPAAKTAECLEGFVSVCGSCFHYCSHGGASSQDRAREYIIEKLRRRLHKTERRLRFLEEYF